MSSEKGAPRCVVTVGFSDYVMSADDALAMLKIASRTEQIKRSGGYGDTPRKVVVDELKPLTVRVECLSDAEYTLGKMTVDDED